MPEIDNTKKDEKWDFSDYAFTITGIIVGLLLVGPELMDSLFDISILGGSFSNAAPTLVEELEFGLGNNVWTLSQLRALSPLLFLLTTTIVYFKDALDARTTGGYTGSMFTHTFESLLEDSIYMAITTIMVYGAVFAGAMYTSWLAGPITWLLFVFIFPLVKKKSSNFEKVNTPWLLLFIFAFGLIAEVVTGAWIAFPLSWLIISAIKLAGAIRARNYSIDSVFDIMYYAFSVILLALGIVLDFWIASWTAFPIGLFICWIISKFGRFKKSRSK